MLVTTFPDPYSAIYAKFSQIETGFHYSLLRITHNRKRQKNAIKQPQKGVSKANYYLKILNLANKILLYFLCTLKRFSKEAIHSIKIFCQTKLKLNLNSMQDVFRHSKIHKKYIIKNAGNTQGQGAGRRCLLKF